MIHVRLAASLAALTLLLVGCTDDDPPPAPAPGPSASDPTPSPSPTPSASPEPLGPAETVRAWVDARNHLVQTGDASLVDRLSASNCSTCRDSTEPVAQIYLDGGHYETFGWRIAALKVAAKEPSRAEVHVGLIYTAGETVPKAGAEPVTYGIERHIAKFRLVKEAGEWKLGFLLYVS